MSAIFDPWFPLETERLLLRTLAPEDENGIHQYASDPEVVRFSGWGPNTPDLTRRFLHIALNEQQTWPRDGVTLALELKNQPGLIGVVRLELKDGVNRMGELGFVLTRLFWGQGLSTEAARAVLNAAFERLRLHRVCATCDVRNLASARVLEKLGMRREGLFRKDLLQKGRWRDSFIYAILSDEWTGLLPANEKGGAAFATPPVR